MGFFSLLSVEASREKKPTPWGFSRKTPVFTERSTKRHPTGVFRENPQGVGFFSRLASTESSEKKKKRPNTFLYLKTLDIFNFDKEGKGSGFFFFA